MDTGWKLRTRPSAGQTKEEEEEVEEGLFKADAVNEEEEVISDRTQEERFYQRDFGAERDAEADAA